MSKLLIIIHILQILYSKYSPKMTFVIVNLFTLYEWWKYLLVMPNIYKDSTIGCLCFALFLFLSLLFFCVLFCLFVGKVDES